MRHLVFSFFFLASALAFGQTAPATAYYANPFAMTITQVLVAPQNDSAKRAHVSVIPERKNVFLMEDHADVGYTYNLQADPTAPVVFVIPGTGGSAESRGALFMAEVLHNIGYTTVTLDDPFSWNFAVAGSASGLPGYIPNDAADFYKAMKVVNQNLVQEKGLRPRSYSLVGASLGGLMALFVQKIDTQFHFEKVLAVNPPLDVLYAVKQLDRLYDEGDKLSDQRKLFVFNRLFDVAADLLKSNSAGQDRNRMQSTFNTLNFSERDMDFLIGGTFRDTLRDVVFASQQVHDLGILKLPVTRHQRNARYDEARGFSFGQYLNQFVYPNVLKVRGAAYNMDKMNRDSSLYQFADTIKNNDHIYVIHSNDDFLLKSGDVAWLKSNFGKRATIFPYGGHCGSMNFPEFATQMETIFKN
jgi:pimeloyl-ACP methyl ester carboxylesterase